MARAALVTGGMFSDGASVLPVGTTSPPPVPVLVAVRAPVVPLSPPPVLSDPDPVPWRAPSWSPKRRRRTGSDPAGNLCAAGVWKKAPGTGRIGVCVDHILSDLALVPSKMELHLEPGSKTQRATAA